MADYLTQQTKGGQYTLAVAAGSGAADAVVSDKPGRLSKFVVTTTASDVLKFYDHATATSGAALIYTTASNIAAGTIVEIDLPVANGITVLKANGSAAGTVFYTEDDVTGAVADKAIPVSQGGQYTSTHAAGSSGASAALAAPGRLCKVSVLSSGSAVTDIYDNASAASGTKLFTVPATPTIGTVYLLEAPVANGIYVAGATDTSQICVSYNKTSAYGR